MFHFNLLLLTTLCVTLSSNALPLTTLRQVDGVHHEITRNHELAIEPRHPLGKPKPPTVKPPPPAPPAAKPPPPPKTSPKATEVKTTPAKTTTEAKTTPISTTSSVAKSSVTTSLHTSSSASQSSSVATSSTSSSQQTTSTHNTSSTHAVTGTSTKVSSSPVPTNGTHVTTTTANNATKTNAASCALPTSTAKKTATPSGKVGRRVWNGIVRLLGRDNEEFIGFHGTNSDTATFWTTNGRISKPPAKSGLLDFLGLTSTSAAGSSGADAELGPGLYIADEPVIAQGFANNNAKVNPGTTAKVCAIFAASSGNWRTVISKAFIPQNLVGDSSNEATAQAKENARLKYIQDIGISTTAAATVKFSLLDRTARTGQMVLPSTITGQFLAKCFDAGTDPATALPGQLPASLDSFRYDSAALRTAWNIKPENNAVADSIANCQ